MYRFGPTQFLLALLGLLLTACGSGSGLPASMVCEKMIACDTDGETLTLAECLEEMEAARQVFRTSSWNALVNCVNQKTCDQLMSEDDGFMDCLQKAMSNAPASAGTGLLKAYCGRLIDCGEYGGSVADCVALLEQQAGEYLGSLGIFNDGVLNCMENCTAGLDCSQLNDFYTLCGLACDLPFVELDLNCENGWQEDDVCVCDEGWAGELCDTCAEGYYPNGYDCVGRCEPDTCSGHGICSDDYGDIWCNCDTGYSGERCEACAEGYLDYEGRCRPQAGCQLDGSVCDDGLICTTADSCTAGVCVGADLPCDDGLACTVDSCLEIYGGCYHDPQPTGAPEAYLGDPLCANGLDDDCDGATDGDDDDCTTLPCTADADCPDDQNPCTAARCLDGLCRWPNLPEASPCPGSDACSSTYICRSGACLPGPADLDADGDGHIDAQCPYGMDCADADAGVHPGAEGPRGDASCTDGLDNDCDGLTDQWDQSCWTQTCTAEGWCLERPRTGDENLSALWALAPDDVWATGGYESVLHWDGTGWEREATGVYWALYDLCGCAPDDIWAVTQTGDVMRYDGMGWQQFESPNDPHILNGIWCDCSTVPSQNVWAVGRPGKVVHYDGLAWTMVDVPPIADLYGVWGSDSGEIWAVGRGGAMLHMHNDVWQVVDTGLTVDLNSVWGHDPTDVWAVGDGRTILHYDGATWNEETIGGTGNLNHVWGLPTGEGPWAVGGSWDGGLAVRWQDGGWMMENGFGDASELFAVGGTAASDLWAVGAGGTIVHYDGATTIELMPTTGRLYAACAFEDANGRTEAWAVGQNEDELLQWDGAEWRINRGNSDRWIEDIWCGGPYGTWTMNEYGDYHGWGPSLSIHATTPDLPTADYLRGMHGRAVDGQVELLAVGDDGLYANYSQGEWTIGYTYSGYAALEAVWLSPDPAGVDAFAVGEYGLMVSRSGSSWTRHEALTGETLKAVWGDGQGTVWVAGDRGVLIKWDGATFTLETVPAEEENLTDVWGTGPDDVWVAARTRILHYDGLTWTAEPVSNGNDRLLAVTPSHVWAISATGGVHHKTR